MVVVCVMEEGVITRVKHLFLIFPSVFNHIVFMSLP